MTIAGKTALVTGGGRGIGEAIAKGLAAKDVKVVVAGRSMEPLEMVAAEIEGVALPLDLSDRAGTDLFLDALESKVGRIDILVNNAGIAESAPLHKVSDESWDRMMEVNALGAFRLCRALIPAMVEEGWGRVVNIASNAGVSGYAYTSAYCASKHAMVGFTRALAMELAKTGVTINAVCPGWVDTDMVATAVERITSKTGRSSEESRASLAKMTPQGRIIQPREVAHLVNMLVSPEALGIHGQALVLDGGQILK